MDNLTYVLIDVLVDSFFKPMKKYGTMLEDAELALNEKPRDSFIINEVVRYMIGYLNLSMRWLPFITFVDCISIARKIKRELLFVQKMIKPMSEVLDDIQNDNAKIHSDSKRAKALAIKYVHSYYISICSSSYRFIINQSHCFSPPPYWFLQ